MIAERDLFWLLIAGASGVEDHARDGRRWSAATAEPCFVDVSSQAWNRTTPARTATITCTAARTTASSTGLPACSDTSSVTSRSPADTARPSHIFTMRAANAE